MPNSDMDESNQLPWAIEPLYETATVNQSIALYSGQLEITQTGQSVNGEGSISLEWLPTARIHFHASGIPLSPGLKLGRVALRIPNGQQAVNPLLSSLELGGKDGIMHWKASGSISSLQVGEGLPLYSCLFHLPNFHDYLGSTAKYERPPTLRQSRSVLEADDWLITIDASSFADQNFYKTLRGSAGYAITHVGKIQKVNAQAFSSDEVRELLGYLAYFFSFCRGSWIAPLLPVGFGRDETRQWKEWRDWKIERWENVKTWFNLHSNKCLSGTFAGCLRRLHSDIWAEPMRLSIWWYISSNARAGGLEGSLVLAQAAFELLAWTYLVEDSKILSKRGFEELPASDKLRLLLSNAKIQLPIPSTLPELQKLSKSFSWQDGPHALTEMRNGLVHPGPKKRRIILDADPIAVFEAWNLSLWYLELLLLWLFDYQGEYSNRLMREVYSSEEVEMVPWTKADRI